MDRTYIAIDLKSFYASYECASRGLDPLKTNLVVADKSRTEKTICLAVSPSLKAYGIGGRARLFEVIEAVKKVNEKRLKRVKNRKFIGKSYDDDELKANKELELDFIIATPRMAKYIEVSSKIYSIYLKYVSKEDILVYSIDEVFIDITNYFKTYKMSAHDIAMMMIKDVLKETRITATAGIGTNMFLAKVAMDIGAKRMKPDKDGVRIAYLDEHKFREEMWDHTPLTDFWRIGRGISNRLIKNGMNTLGDVCLMSLKNEDKLYDLLGINAELLIDHAWGVEPVTIKDVKAYKPESTSMSSGQVLSEGYDYKKARIIVKEMVDALSLDLVSKDLLTDQIVLYIGYDANNLKDYNRKYMYKGPIVRDYIGREVPKPAHSSINLGEFTSSSKLMIEKCMELYDSIVNPILLIKRLNIAFMHTTNYKEKKEELVQMDLFSDYDLIEKKKEENRKKEEKEKKLQKTVIEIHKKYGKNSVLKGVNLLEGATMKERNEQIGGHKK